MTVSTRAIALAMLVASAIAGAHWLKTYLIAQGDARGAARVQAAWDAQEAQRNAATARDNATKFRNAERLAHEDAQAQAARHARDAAAAATVRGLRAEIDRLNSRPHPYPAGDAGLAACAGEATAARELFGESAGAYQALAAEADGLRDQVTGLQDFALRVCRAGSAPSSGPVAARSRD
ncbi:hypothetical protein SAMN05428957_10875 [Oryzisolibacter propanilivorax]|uniref:Bacteriophage Rz lysis protein n=1 Tax=Oryzisolibacter propanilivorax TaxID=1527607 RepID=A0A1G9UB59_9BURK|nr:hypothetical protein [Oryzisolibacter propanilivorax]SDM56954.1 hypothetical protein SAMN05428957_10875 [Oryzisolibacter propanilivorax]